MHGGGGMCGRGAMCGGGVGVVRAMADTTGYGQ